MTETELYLEDSVSGVVGADGTVTLVIGPQKPMERWIAEQISVNNNGILTPRVDLYRGAPGQTSFVEGTRSGNGDMTDTKQQLMSGESLSLKWTGASPGSTSVATARGRRFLRGRRGY